MQSLHGKVLAIVDNANPGRVFEWVELPEALANKNITEFMGQSREAIRELYAREGIDGIKQLSRAQGEALAPLLSEDLRAAYPRALDTAAAREATGGALARDAAAGVRGVAGTMLSIATLVPDAAQSLSTAHDFAQAGNLSARDSEIVHFATRNLGIFGGAALGAGLGAAAGVETGPGAILTGLAGGVVGAVGGDSLAQWYDQSKIDTQTDRNGTAWTRSTSAPEQWTHRSRGHVTTADAQTTHELNFKATSTAAELALAKPPVPQDPNRLPAGPNDTQGAGSADWQRDVKTGQWQRDLAHHAGRAVYTAHEVATPARAAELDRASAAVVAHNIAESPAATTLRYQAAYLRNGWEKFGPMPPALAQVSTDTLLASDGDTYARGADGRWTHDGMLSNSVATGNLKSELDVTRATLQGELAAVRPALERLREQHALERTAVQHEPAAKTPTLRVFSDGAAHTVGDGFHASGTVPTYGDLVAVATDRDAPHKLTLFSRHELLENTAPDKRAALDASLRDGHAIDVDLGKHGLAVHDVTPAPHLAPAVAIQQAVQRPHLER